MPVSPHVRHDYSILRKERAKGCMKYEAGFQEIPNELSFSALSRDQGCHQPCGCPFTPFPKQVEGPVDVRADKTHEAGRSITLGHVLGRWKEECIGVLAFLSKAL